MDYTGKTIYLGIDVHKRTYSITAVCEGVVIKRNTFSASPEMLLKYCKKAFKGAIMKSAYEAGFCGFVLHRFLLNHGIENIVVHPGNIEIESRNHRKTDKRDSQKIAIQLAQGRLTSVFVPTSEMENRRFISRLRESYVKQRARISIQIKSLLNLNGLIPFDNNQRITKKFLISTLNKPLTTELKFCIASLGRAWIYYSNEIKNIEKELNKLTSKEQELFNQYRKIIGFGPTIARVLVQELGDTTQFSNEAKLFSYCGLTPSEHSSGEHKRLGHITHQGKPILRKVLVQAAWVAVRKDPCLSEFFTKLSSKRGSCRAIIAVARKLIGRARCAIRKKDEYLVVKAEDKVVLQEDLIATSSSTLVGSLSK